MTLEAVETILREDEEAWRELCVVLDAHPEVNLHDASSKPWNSRDAYAHLARWLEYNATKISAMTKGNPIPVTGESVEAVNKIWEAEDASLSLKEARRRAVNAYELRKRILKSVPLSGWNSEIEKFARLEGASHFREHLSYMVLTDA